MKILLVEDNENIVKGITYSLEQNNYIVDISVSINDSLNKLKNNKYDLIILDITLPDGNGFDLYQIIKDKYDTKTIFLTARDDESDIVHGLELGAEDYIVKPFSMRELLARINKTLLKSNANNIITIDDITFDLDKMIVYKNKKEIPLTSLEIKILSVLFTNINKVVRRSYIIDKIWDWTGNDVNDNTITVYLKRIREKLNTDIIKTVKGIGYRIDKDEKQN